MTRKFRKLMTSSANFGVYYDLVDPTIKSTKNFSLKKNSRKLSFKFVLFDIILQNMLLGETFPMVYFKCVSCNGKLVKIAF